VLERIGRVAGHPLQRVGLSATVGNPDDLLAWLQGSGRGIRTASVVAPEAGVSGSATPASIELDYVGSVDNAATVIATLHRGEKRLVFCDSRALVEQLGAALRERDVTTFLSHASLSMDERRRAESAFADARDCVIVSTSTLELGIDVGDLDRVIQINAPGTVAAFLQRLGRTGRRPGSIRNCLFLTLTPDDLLSAAGLLLLWSTGFVEPVTAPPEPRHIVAQQLLALCLQEHAVGDKLWVEGWNGLAPFDRSAEPIVRYLTEQGFVDRDGELLLIGPHAEQVFGRRHFMDMTSVFTAAPEFTVLSGRREIGRTDPALLTERVAGPRVLLLAGRNWRVVWIDWKRRRCHVEPTDLPGKARWHSPAVGGAGFALSRAARDVLLGQDPPVHLTRRAQQTLGRIRDERLAQAHPGGTVILRDRADVRWWTWAGHRANATLTATLSGLTDDTQRFDDLSIRLRADLTADLWRAGTCDAPDWLCLPDVDEKALAGLKFGEALPPRLAVATLAARLADLDGAARVLAEPTRFTTI
jgi:ATP-dependent Lhr-like helicase